MDSYCCSFLVSPENIPCIHLAFHVFQTVVKAVGNDGLALCLEFVKIIYDLAAEEGGAVFKGRLVDDDFCTLGLDALHDALYGTLTEIVTVRLHGQTVDTDDAGSLTPAHT